MVHELDSRIDILNPQVVFANFEMQWYISMKCLIQESLAKMEAPKFDTNLLKSVPLCLSLKYQFMTKYTWKYWKSNKFDVAHSRGNKRALKIFLANKKKICVWSKMSNTLSIY